MQNWGEQENCMLLKGCQHSNTIRSNIVYLLKQHCTSAVAPTYCVRCVLNNCLDTREGRQQMRLLQKRNIEKRIWKKEKWAEIRAHQFIASIFTFPCALPSSSIHSTSERSSSTTALRYSYTCIFLHTFIMCCHSIKIMVVLECPIVGRRAKNKSAICC